MQRRVALALVVCIVAALGCGGCRWPSEKAVYRIARRTVKKSDEIPEGAVPAPMRKTIISMAKNAARVDIPSEFVDASGQMQTRWHTVWCKRIDLRWELDRAFPTPRYPTP